MAARGSSSTTRRSDARYAVFFEDEVGLLLAEEDLAVAQAVHGPAGFSELPLAFRVALAVAQLLVELRAVGLDDDALRGPDEVASVAEDPRVDLRLREAVVSEQLEEPLLELGPREGEAEIVGFQGVSEGRDAVAAVCSEEEGLELGVVQASVDLGLVDGLLEGAGRQDVGRGPGGSARGW
jgi:hypothetical protein